MSKLFRTLALAALLAGGTAAVTVAPAQDKGKPAKADDAKKGKKGGKVEVLENKAGKFYFKIISGDGKVLAMSPVNGFAEKADAVKAVETLKEILESTKITYPPKKAAPDDDKEEMEEKKEKKKGKG